MAGEAKAYYCCTGSLFSGGRPADLLYGDRPAGLSAFGDESGAMSVVESWPAFAVLGAGATCVVDA